MWCGVDFLLTLLEAFAILHSEFRIVGFKPRAEDFDLRVLGVRLVRAWGLGFTVYKVCQLMWVVTGLGT